MDQVEFTKRDDAYFKQRTRKLLDKTLPQLLLDWSETQADKEAVVVYSKGHERREAVTYGELITRAKCIGTNLIARGQTMGARVGLLGPNSLDWVLCNYGATVSGALVLKMKVEMLNDPEQCAKLLTRHKVGLLIYAGDIGGDANEKLSMLQELSGNSVQYLEMSDICAQEEVSECSEELETRIRNMKPDDPVSAFFTSGTSGQPKVVVYTHNTTTDAGFSLFAHSTVSDVFWGDRAFTWSACGLDFAVPTKGMTAVYSPPSFETRPHTIVKLIKEEKITCAFMITLILSDLVDYGTQHDISVVKELHWIVTGGDAVTVEFWNRVKDTLPCLAMVYASTEVVPLSNTFSLGVDTGRAGVIAENVELKIMKDGEGVAKRGEPGEIWVRSPRLTPGYLDQPEETARVIDAEGWWKTGDIGVLSPENLLKVVGRKKYFISRGALKINPSIVEELIHDDDRVKAVCVIGVPDPRLFEKICACVVLEKADRLTSDDVANLFKTKCGLTTEGRGLLPDHVLIFSNLPFNNNGKVDREKLKKFAIERLSK